MFYRLRQSIARGAFGLWVRDIFQSPSLHLDGGQELPAIVSQVCHRDIAMYLLAVKSFARFHQLRAVFALDDGSLTAEDRETLSAHIPGIRFFSITGFRSAECPRGGTWERLLFIAEEVQRGYVIQLDADTLTLKPLDEVRDAVRTGHSFTLGTALGRNIVTVGEAAEAARLATRHYESRRVKHIHIQLAAEILLDQLPMSDRSFYARGCSGFTGFARQSIGRTDVERFSREMSTRLGRDRWNEWGSEQVTSNFLVANSAPSRVLPLPGYDTFEPYCDLTSSKFIHFLGTHRFRGGVYASKARTVIREHLVNFAMNNVNVS